ncbi:MAG: lipid-A-disaccharide synthase [Planctomycetota bacterium]|jgi:lipid-A-disaccharide synthase
MPRIFMCAGEQSGVNIGATLMRTLKSRLDDISFAGLGGDAMVDEGLEQIYDLSRTATMWLWGNLKRIPAHRRALELCIADWEANRPDLVITIDYQAFHLYLGSAARERGIPVLHYVSSQFWARRYWTLEPIRRAYDHVLCIHEFEKPYYDAAGIPATFIGHPLFERLERRELDEQLMEEMRALPGPRIGLLPGSRRSEIKLNLPVMLDAVKSLPGTPHVLVSCGRPDSKPLVEELVQRSGLPGKVVDFGSGEILSSCDLALITSGSASMEAVYYGCACVIVYRIDFIMYFFAKPHIATHIGQPNLVAGELIAPEFLLPSRASGKVAAAVRNLLDNAAARNAQVERYARIKAHLLEGPPPSERAADVAVSMLNASKR